MILDISGTETKFKSFLQREVAVEILYPATWQANLVGDILHLLANSYDRRLIRNTTLLLVLSCRYDRLQ